MAELAGKMNGEEGERVFADFARAAAAFKNMTMDSMPSLESIRATIYRSLQL
jgi:hypothetical protein